MAVKASLKGSEPVSIPLSPPIETEPEDLDSDATGFKVVSAVESESPIPDFPAKTIRADQQHLFFDWIDSLQEHHRRSLSIYMYRAWPIIKRKPLYIDCLTGSFTIADLLKNHGGGEYKFLVNDVNKAVNGKGGTLGHAYASFVGADYPDPILKLDELDMDARNNRGYIDKLIATGVLSSDGKVMTQIPPAASNDNAQLIGLLSRLIERTTNQPQQQLAKDPAADVSKMFIEANSAVVGMLKEQVKTDSPAQLVTMLAAFKDLIPKPENNNTTLELIMKMMSDAQVREAAATERFMALLMKEPVDTESKVLEKIGIYKELFGGEGGGREPKRTLAETIIEHGSPILFKGLEMLNNVLSMKNYKAGMQQQTQMPQDATQSTQDAPQQQIEGSNVVEMPKQQEQGNQFAAMLEQYGGFIIQAIQRDDTGSMFAESVSVMAGPLVYKQIAAIGREEILAGMKASQKFWGAVSGLGISEKILTEWVNDFVSFGEGEAQEDGE